MPAAMGEEDEARGRSGPRSVRGAGGRSGNAVVGM
jgi:hypothetical protein